MLLIQFLCSLLYVYALPGILLNRFLLKPYGPRLSRMTQVNFIFAGSFVLTFIFEYCLRLMFPGHPIASWIMFFLLLTFVIMTAFQTQFSSLLTVVRTPVVLNFTIGSLLLSSILLLIFYKWNKEVHLPFMARDTIASWNRWAIDWSQGHMPKNMWHYLQGIPHISGTVYIFLGKPIDYFAKIAQSFFVVMALVNVIYFCKHHVRSAWIILVFATFYSSILFNGLVDPIVGSVPVLWYFGLRDIWQHSGGMVDLENQEKQGTSYQFIIYGVVLALCTSLVKSSGVLLFLYFLFFIPWRYVLKNRTALIFLLGSLGFVIFNLFYLELLIQRGLGNNEIENVTSLIYGNQTRLEIFINALKKLFHAREFLFLLSMAGLLFSSIVYAVKSYRVRPLNTFKKTNFLDSNKSLNFFILAYFFLWAFFISYDTRNLGLISFLAPIMLSENFDEFFGKINRSLITFSIPLNKIVTVIFTCIGLWFTFFLTKKDPLIQTLHREKILFVGDPSINQALQKVSHAHKILTNYQYLIGLPGFENKLELNYLSHGENLKNSILSCKSDFALIPLPMNCSDCQNNLQELQSLKKISKIFEDHHFQIYQLDVCLHHFTTDLNLLPSHGKQSL